MDERALFLGQLRHMSVCVILENRFPAVELAFACSIDSDR